MSKSWILTTSVLSLLSGGALAQTNESDESVFVVEGTRLEQRLDESATAITVLSADDLEALGFPFALDALATAPGVTINQNGGFGGVASVRIRGNGSDQTLVIIDGVPVGDASSVGGGFDFARLDTGQIERIEILRGAQSTLWGSEAIGGVISITTKDADDGLSAFSEYGSFNTIRGGASASGRGETGGWQINAVASSSDGISKADEDQGNTEEDGYRNHSLSGRFDQQFGRTKIIGSAIASSAETEFDGFDFNAPGFVADADERNETNELTVSLRAEVQQTENLEHTVTIGGSDIERSNFNAGAPAFAASGQRAVLRYQGNANLGERAKLAFGTEADFREAGDDSTSIVSVFALNELNILDNLTLTTGLRVDDHADFGSETTARVNAAWTLRTGITTRASFGQGFKAPSLFQQTFFCCGATGPAEGLKPERSEGFDAGVIFSAPRVSLDLGWFTQTTEDLIDFSFPVGAYFNVSEVETEGVEVALNADVLSWLDVQLSYAFIDAEGPNNTPLNRVPRHSGDALFVIDPVGPWSANILVRHNGEETDGANEVDAWTRVDVNAAYQINDTLEIYARIDNLFDAEYQQVLGYGTPDRSGTVGLRVSY
ncbi:MAG: TonB-dependent receptor [Pseudomonadota bacterium]